MNLRFLGGDTGNGGSPRLYRDGDDYLVQGYLVTEPELLAKLRIPPGETVVRVPESLWKYLPATPCMTRHSEGTRQPVPSSGHGQGSNWQTAGFILATDEEPCPSRLDQVLWEREAVMRERGWRRSRSASTSGSTGQASRSTLRPVSEIDGGWATRSQPRRCRDMTSGS